MACPQIGDVSDERRQKGLLPAEQLLTEAQLLQTQQRGHDARRPSAGSPVTRSSADATAAANDTRQDEEDSILQLRRLARSSLPGPATVERSYSTVAELPARGRQRRTAAAAAVQSRLQQPQWTAPSSVPLNESDWHVLLKGQEMCRARGRAFDAQFAQRLLLPMRSIECLERIIASDEFRRRSDGRAMFKSMLRGKSQSGDVDTDRKSPLAAPSELHLMPAARTDLASGTLLDVKPVVASIPPPPPAIVSMAHRLPPRPSVLPSDAERELARLARVDRMDQLLSRPAAAPI